MSEVKNGYNSQPTRLKFSARDSGRLAEMTIEQEGVERYAPHIVGGGDNRNTNKFVKIDGYSETLAYITLEELLDLRDEINSVIQELVA